MRGLAFGALVAIALATVASPAQPPAQPPPQSPDPLPPGATVDRGNGSFFNRPGATSDQILSDTARCAAIAQGTDSQINAINVVAGGLGAIIGGALAGKRQRRINIENCMLIRGWRLYAMTRAEGAAWKALAEDDRDRQLAVLIGAEAPSRGTLLRQWRNDYAEPVLWPKD